MTSAWRAGGEDGECGPGRLVVHALTTYRRDGRPVTTPVWTAPLRASFTSSRRTVELRIVNETGVPFRYFFGGEAPRRYAMAPDRLVERRGALRVGDTEFVLHPVRGAETDDALLVHLPGRGVLFVGDTFMPYLGAPFLPEGSPEALFENIALIR
jgi:glyoxylase-like metal-dependent hydrolase (beta-lactamase superfamily II)